MRIPNLGKLFMLILLVMLVSGSANAAPGPAAGKPQPVSKPAPTIHHPLFFGQYVIKMASADLGWIVGWAGQTVQYRDGIWHAYPSPTYSDLNAVDATTNEAWTVGDGNVIMRNTGTGWQLLASPITTPTAFIKVNIVAPGEVWVLGDPNVLLHYVNGNWTVAATPPVLGEISWGSPSDAWLVGGYHFYHYVAGLWSGPIDCADCYGVPVKVLMVSPDEGWASLHSCFTGDECFDYRLSLAHYQQGSWHPSLSDKPAAPATAGPAKGSGPNCGYYYSLYFAEYLFPNDGAYEIEEGYIPCEGDPDMYHYLRPGPANRWDGIVSGIAGTSMNDIWYIVGSGYFYHWDGTNLTNTTACLTNYNDVTPDHFAYAAVTYLSCHGIVAGTGANTFSPAANATRIQFAKMITLARGWPLTTPVTPTFSDVPASHPLYAYVEAAYANGAISGATQAQCQARNQAYPCFFPNDNVTRAQTSVITKRAFGWADDTTGGPHFSDVAQNFYAYAAIETCYNHNIINGVGGGQFAPNADVTRAQLAVILARTLIRGH